MALSQGGRNKRGAGAKPGERRGGRSLGTKDKTTEARDKRLADAMAAATEAVGDAAINAMSPKDVMLFVMRLAASAGWWFKAAEIAKEVAPYIHAKLANTVIDDQRKKDPTDFRDDELEALAQAGVVAEYAADKEDRLAN